MSIVSYFRVVLYLAEAMLMFMLGSTLRWRPMRVLFYLLAVFFATLSVMAWLNTSGMTTAFGLFASFVSTPILIVVIAVTGIVFYIRRKPNAK